MPVLRNVGRQLEVGDVVNRLGHTLSGVAAGVWSLPVAPISGAAGSVVWVAAVTGFALAPDLDHPKATAANMWGPVTRAPSAFLTHRGFTHRPAGVAAAVVTAWAAVTGALAPLVTAVAAVFGHAHPGQLGHTVGAWALLAVLAVTAGLALAAARVPWPLNLPASWAAAAATVWVGFPLAWLPWAVALGVAVHIAGDRVPGHREPIAVALCLAALAAWPYRAHLGALIEGVNA